MAADGVRDSLSRRQQEISDAYPTDDAVLRTALTAAITLGLVIGRHLLQLDGLRDAHPEQIIDLLRPCIQALTPRPLPRHDRFAARAVAPDVAVDSGSLVGVFTS
jgi:hypothetical protein